MTRSLTLAAACVTAAAILLVSTTEAKQAQGDRSDWFDPYELRYLDAYEKAHEAGLDVGANLVDDNIGGRQRVEESTERLERWMAPAPATPDTPATPTATPAPSSVATASGGYSIPSYIVECESGGDYGASNPSGAYGAYQIMPGTASAYGCDLSTPSGQDACAAEIYADVGSSAWVCG